MAYDKKTGTVTTSGDREQFERDMSSHFAHVEAQVNAELAERAKKKSWRHRIGALSRTAKLSIVAFVTWTLFVWFRTADSYEVLGVDLHRWDDDFLLMNWLVVPTALLALIKAIQWALRSKRS